MGWLQQILGWGRNQMGRRQGRPLESEAETGPEEEPKDFSSDDSGDSEGFALLRERAKSMLDDTRRFEEARSRSRRNWQDKRAVPTPVRLSELDGHDNDDLIFTPEPTDDAPAADDVVRESARTQDGGQDSIELEATPADELRPRAKQRSPDITPPPADPVVTEEGEPAIELRKGVAGEAGSAAAPATEKTQRAKRGKKSRRKDGGQDSIELEATPADEHRLREKQRLPDITLPPADPVVTEEGEPVIELGKAGAGETGSAAAPATEKPQQPKRRKGIRRKQSVAHIHVGIDFGTSTTKVAYRQLGVSGRMARPLVKRHKLSAFDDFCVPSVAAFDSHGELQFGVAAAKALGRRSLTSGFRWLKMLVAGKYDSSFSSPVITKAFDDYCQTKHAKSIPCILPEVLTVAYLAYTLRNVRDELTRQIDQPRHEFYFNLPVPIDYIESNRVCEPYVRVMALAEKVADDWPKECCGNDFFDFCHENWQKSTEKTCPSDRLHVIPESVAQTAAYLQSRGKSDGIHAFIDFGAGTTDVNILDLRNSRLRGALPKPHWYAAKNLPRGTHYIEEIIHQWRKKKKMKTNAAAILEDIRMLKGRPDDLRKEVTAELNKVWVQSRASWASAYKYFKQEKYWMADRVTVYVGGGGALNPLVPDVFKKSWMKGWGPYKVEDIPVPVDFDKGAGAPFSRMSVAYGLTFPEPELAKFSLPSEQRDRTPRRKRMPVRDVDELYPT